MKKCYWRIIGITLLAFILSGTISFRNFSILSFIMTFAILEFILFLVINKLPDTLKIKNNSKKISKKEMIIYCLLIIIPIIISVIAYYPGIIVPDSISSWNQAHLNNYNNWHPIFYSIIFFRIPTLIFDNVISCTIFQDLIIFSILLYFCIFLRKNYLGFKETILVLLLLIFNPIVLKDFAFLIKDIPYSWMMFLITLYLINIVKSDGKWLNSIKNKVMFIIASLGIFLFRHNGIVPFFFTFLGLIIFYPKLRKFLSITLVTIFIIYFGVIGNICNLKTGGKAEMIGVVMGQISYYYNNDVLFTDKELEVMDKLAPLEIWKSKYIPGNFNEIKWASDSFYEEASKNENFKKIMSMWFTKSIQNPDQFIASYMYITSPIWEVKLDYGAIDYEILDYKNNISSKGNFLNPSNYVYEGLVKYNQVITRSPLRWFMLNYGDSLILILISLYLIIKKTKMNLRKWLPFVPVILNTMVIMVLITGGEYRFVYSQVLCYFPLLLYGVYEKKDYIISKHSKKLKEIRK